MKKICIIFVLLCIALISAKAQLKLHSNGYLTFNTNTSTPLSPVSLNYNGNPDSFLAYYGSKRFSYAVTTNNYFTVSFVNKCNDNGNMIVSTNMYSRLNEGATPHPNQVGIGGWGRTENLPYAVGLLGNIIATTGGAGIVAAYDSIMPSTSLLGNNRYAGFFIGNVNSTGNLVASGSIQGTVLGTSAAGASEARSLSEIYGDDIVGVLSGLEAYSCPSALEAKTAEVEQIELDDSTIVTITSQDWHGEHARQTREHSHFALDSRQLAKVLPDLVYTSEDGTESINYLELVPLLVRCINELNTRLSALDGGASIKPASARSETTASQVLSMGSTTDTSQAVLYQNTPNPFTAQTEIRFSLPDDATNACICIFDMTGKLLKKLPISSDFDSVTVNGYELGEGIYLYSLVVNSQEVDTKRMILTK